MRKGDHLFLVDGSGYIFRAYHALPPLTRKSDGLPVGAVSGFCNMLYKLIEDTKDEFEPTHLAVIFDHSAKTFRNDIYPLYKAHRPEPPEDLRPQFALVRDAVRAFTVPCIEMKGYEADDLIATYARLAQQAGARVTIVSSDKDLMQLVSADIDMLDTMKMKTITETEVIEKFGVPPEKVIEVQALAGDSVDNVPGVPGIGIKTAAELINSYGDLDTLLERASEIKQNKRRENLIAFAEQARISKRLVTLDANVPVDVPVEEMGIHAPDPERLIAFLKDMEFSTLTRRVAEKSGVDIEKIAPAGTHPAQADASAAKPKAAAAVLSARGGVPGALRTDTNPPFAEAKHIGVTKLAELEACVARAREAGVVAIDTETDSLDPMQARLVGFSICSEPGHACYVPLQHGSGGALDLDNSAGAAQIPMQDALKALKPLFEDASVLKVGQNLKYDLIVFEQHGLKLTTLDDTMLMSYALDAGLHGHGMDELSELHLGHKPIAFSEVAGTGKARVTFDQVPIDKAVAYAAEDADVTLRLWHALKPRLVAERRVAVYETLERPLVPILLDMERAGIKVDRNVLARLSGDFAQKMAQYEDEIYELAGHRFNIGSPKQLGEILYDKMGHEGGRKTKTGAWSTDSDALEALAAQGHALPQRVLDWRGLAKLKSTYTDLLPTFIHPETGRVHTCYSLASTTTGRLSSSDPNLQNIPVRTEDGRKIRTAFIADKGNKLISADYSQIELRLLAHIADIPALRQAFADGLDIHAMTASEMFGVPVKGMDPAVRRRAKAINFGIIYGISAFGLANQLGIPRSEAGEYIDRYFKRFPGIRAYMDATKEFAHANGYVETIFGRRVHVPAINSKNPAERSFMERAAINAPIQGSAADIIRRAMIRMPQALAKARLKARMLLQVHDELIFEAPENEADKTCALVASIMAAAPEPARKLSVPLDVDARAANNWDEAH
ncbi:MAG: DNA polymerase I [Parvibaculum sp.]|uniref:DNA polymerase I n=1 Tax=Parvibaculum sp. TaxID=2024848 RepID=UPI0025F5FDA3|nr:DNA polymerase I [Parvibaculum sp.]MCE9650014.1 DNA polymerase I [Parvibaculum sp.]